MQFKYPELFWALFLLLIPIIIHLFQLRRFKKTPFTNVKFLKKVISESRKSNLLKKWALLATRMALLTALIFAFAQPFFAKKDALREKETVIYIDNSFSMQAKTTNGTLLSDAVQELLQVLPEEKTFSLFTNTNVFRNVTLKAIQNDLLTLPHTTKQLNLDEVSLKAKTLFTREAGTIKNLVVLSDFQKRMMRTPSDSLSEIQTHLIQLRHSNLENISIDSVYLSSFGSETIELTALLSSNYSLESTPVSLYNGEKLIAKTSASFTTNHTSSVVFSLPAKDNIKGRIQLSDAALEYDNTLYFSIDEKEKIKVLVIGAAQSDFLKRIYTEDEFEFVSASLKELNYSIISSQNLIILNELESLPNTLSTALESFKTNTGSLVVIPAVKSEINSYNQLLSKSYATGYTEQFTNERSVTGISFSHPIYQGVFEKNVTNFQYPKVSTHYGVKTTAPSVLSYQDKAPFLLGTKGFYVFTAALSQGNSNFKSAPLIVPTFYRIGVVSLQSPELYYQLGAATSQLDIPVKLAQDRILKIVSPEYEFIPKQDFFANKVSLSFTENPTSDGIYALMNGDKILRNLSFNHSREESMLVFSDLTAVKGTTTPESIAIFFENIQKEGSINELWKWFIIFALFFMVIEVLIQKYVT